MMDDRSVLPLGDVLTRVKVPVAIEDALEYKQVTVRINGRGLRTRALLPGSAIKTKRQFKIATDQLLVSKIDARNGGIGTVPPNLDGAIVSGDFPSFEIDKRRCLPAYLDLYVKRREFWDECLLVSEGSTNRVRLVLDQFLDLEIEFPPIDQQQRIVSAVEIIRAAEEASRREAVSAERVLMAARREFIESTDEELVLLGEVVQNVEGGKSPRCLDRHPEKEEYGVLKVSAIRDGVFHPDEAKTLPAEAKPWRQTVRDGDLLYSRANTSGLVGALCRVQRDHPHLLLCDKTMRLNVDEGRVDPDYLVEAMGSPAAREQIELMAGGTSDSMKNISQAAYLETEIALPPLRVQQALAQKFRALRRLTVSASKTSHRTAQVRAALVDEFLTGRRSMA